ncbi:MAG TPA: hypothetical protein VJV78_04885, partial [Polyangiales bacterium]|nr:hypothetical protein [Polyangiales bacterium]
MKQLWRALYCAGLSLAAVSCSSDPTPATQLMVVVDSDVSGIDSVRVTVQGMDDGDKVAIAGDLTKQPLPRTVAVVHGGGKLGPITVVAQAYRGRFPVVTQRARVSFVSKHNMMLRFDLDEICLAKTCGSEDTCDSETGECVDSAVPEDELRDWPGMVPESDAGTLVAGRGG